MSFKPVLIHRFDNNINQEIHLERARREKIEKLLNNLKAALKRWYKEPPSLDALFDFLEETEPKSVLLEPYIKAAAINGLKVKPDKVEELLEIPSYDHIIEMHEQLNGYTQETNWRQWHDGKTGKFSAPTLTVKEKEKIVEFNSIYAQNEADLRTFKELVKIKEAQNYFAERGLQFISRLKFNKHLGKLFVWNQKEESLTRMKSRVLFLDINWEELKSPGFSPTLYMPLLMSSRK